MFRYILPFCFYLFGNIFCFGQQTNKSILINGVTRNYIEYKPAGLNPNLAHPLVIVLHGLGGNSQQMTQIGFNAIADTADFVVLYAQGLLNTYNQASWNNGTGLSSNAEDDLFFTRLIDLYLISGWVDPSRVYVTGFSMGSIMSHHLALALNSKIAAIGAMAGPLSTVDSQRPYPSYPTPVIHLHGTEDGTVPYDQNPLPTLTLVPETMNYWRNAHGCSNATDSVRIADVQNDGITIDQFTYLGCTQNAAVELWRLNGADHIYLYEPIHDITESKVIWQFFSRFQHPSPASPSAATLPESQVEPLWTAINPAENSTLFIHSQAEMEIFIYQSDGDLVASYHLKKGKNSIDFPFSSGLYFVSDGTHPARKLVVH